jgi:hypothetical protein
VPPAGSALPILADTDHRGHSRRLHQLGRLEEAERAYLDVLEVHEARHFTSVDRGLRGFKANQNLAVVGAGPGGP